MLESMARFAATSICRTTTFSGAEISTGAKFKIAFTPQEISKSATLCANCAGTQITASSAASSFIFFAASEIPYTRLPAISREILSGSLSKAAFISIP